MRTRLCAVLTVAAAVGFLPAAPASAGVCAYTYQVLTGHCDPCPEIAGAYNTVNDAAGRPLPSMYCPA